MSTTLLFKLNSLKLECTFIFDKLITIGQQASNLFQFVVMRYAKSFSCLEVGVGVQFLPLEADFGAAVSVLFLGLSAVLSIYILVVSQTCFYSRLHFLIQQESIILWLSNFQGLSNQIDHVFFILISNSNDLSKFIRKKSSINNRVTFFADRLAHAKPLMLARMHSIFIK